MHRRTTYQPARHRLTRRQRFTRRGMPLLGALAMALGASVAVLLPAPAAGTPALYSTAEQACIAAGEC